MGTRMRLHNCHWGDRGSLYIRVRRRRMCRRGCSVRQDFRRRRKRKVKVLGKKERRSDIRSRLFIMGGHRDRRWTIGIIGGICSIMRRWGLPFWHRIFMDPLDSDTNSAVTYLKTGKSVVLTPLPAYVPLSPHTPGSTNRV